MIPYLILLFTVTMMAYLGRINSSKGVKNLSIIIISLLLVLFAGLRDRAVGTDTGTYISLFMRYGSLDNIFLTQEVGFNTLRILTKTISDNYAIHLVSIALIVVSCYMLTIVRLTKRYETAVFLFIALGFYTFFFNGARQGIAAAICFFALPWLLERKPKQYFLLVGLAFLFHKTAFIAAPLYFIAVSRVGWRQILGVITGAIIITLFLSVFVQVTAVLFGDKYSEYSIAKEEGGGRVTTLFLVCQGLLFYMFKPKLSRDNEVYNRLLNIYLIGLVPIVAAALSNVNPSGILRLHLYFSGTAILLWPMIFMSWKDTPRRMLISLAFAVFTIVYFTLTTSSFSHLIPYQINQGAL